jgi:hypothetical protein
LSGFVDQIRNVNGVIVCALVTGLVFAEDAFFLGFLIPGERPPPCSAAWMPVGGRSRCR